MSRRRLDRLEGSLAPREAVNRWLGEAHAFGSLPAYVDSLIGQPDTAQPFVALPAQVEKAVYEAMRGRRSGFVKEVMREAIGDTIFLLRLVIGLNVHIEETQRFESLRLAAHVGWSRALQPAPGSKAKSDRDRQSRLDRGAEVLSGTLLGTERARAEAEARYLDGHDCLFPELAAEWHELCAAVEALTDDESPDDEPARKQAEQRLQRVVLMARADGLEASGQSADADALARRVVAAGRGPE